MSAPSPYQVLGVAHDATELEIKAAWKIAAKASHPDRHPNDPHAAERFKRAQAAYQELSDPDRRKRLDATPPQPARRKPPRTSVPWWMQQQADAQPTTCVTCGCSCEAGAVRCDGCWADLHQHMMENGPNRLSSNRIDIGLDALRHAQRVCWASEQARLEQIFGAYGVWTRGGTRR